MAVTSATAKVSYAGNGSTTVFTVTFRFLEKSHVQVILRDAQGGETAWTEGTQYTLSGTGGTSGTLTVKTSPTNYTPASGETLVITRNVPRTQEVDYGENDNFPAETHERALDKLTMLVQQQDEAASRALVVPSSDTAADLSLPIDSLRASKFLAFDATGKPIAAAGTTSDFQPVSAYIDTLLDDGDAATARTTLGAAGLTGNETIAGNKTFSGVTTHSGQSRLAKGANIASAATLVIGSDGNFFDVTGSTGPITAMTVTAGTRFWLRFLSTPMINYNGTSLITPRDANITVEAGDIWELFALANNQVIVTNVLRANGFMLNSGVIGWAWSFTSAEATGTTTIPDDDTIPQSTEGNEIRTINYTPFRSDSTLWVDAWWNGGHGTSYVEFWGALFLDSETSARRVAASSGSAAAQMLRLHLQHHHTGHSAGVQHTWKLRVGSASAGTLYTNRSSDGDKGGGGFTSGLRVLELLSAY
ncbi:MAG: hypothetical protein AAF563_12425 [Pseudomonadota bacterium]